MCLFIYMYIDLYACIYIYIYVSNIYVCIHMYNSGNIIHLKTNDLISSSTIPYILNHHGAHGDLRPNLRL